MMGIYTGISLIFETLMGWVGRVSSPKGHSVEWYTYRENNGCPPPSCDDYLTDDMLNSYRIDTKIR